jgi:hypothetical protein
MAFLIKMNDYPKKNKKTKKTKKCDTNKIVNKMAQILKIENSKYCKIFYNNFQQVAKNIERFCFFFFGFRLLSE